GPLRCLGRRPEQPSRDAYRGDATPEPCATDTPRPMASQGLLRFEPCFFLEREGALLQLLPGQLVELFVQVHGSTVLTLAVASRAMACCSTWRAWLTCHLLVPSLIPSICAIS